MGTANLHDRLLYPASVRIQLEQMGDLGVPFLLPATKPTETGKRQRTSSPEPQPWAVEGQRSKELLLADLFSHPAPVFGIHRLDPTKR